MTGQEVFNPDQSGSVKHYHIQKFDIDPLIWTTHKWQKRARNIGKLVREIETEEPTKLGELQLMAFCMYVLSFWC